MKFTKEELIVGVILAFSVLIFLCLLGVFLPLWTPIDKEKAITNNISELNLIYDDNAYEIAIKASNWVKTETINMWWSIESRKFLFINYNYCLFKDSGLCIAKYNDKLKLVYFLRSGDKNRIYYFMKSKKGLCSEGAIHIMKIMDYFGYEVRFVKINNWDHVWIEFFDENNVKYYVDPYVGIVTNDFAEFKENTNWGLWDNPDKFLATDINGNELDISEEYFFYLKNN
jgi:hypothetical protein